MREPRELRARILIHSAAEFTFSRFLREKSCNESRMLWLWFTAALVGPERESKRVGWERGWLGEHEQGHKKLFFSSSFFRKKEKFPESTLKKVFCAFYFCLFSQAVFLVQLKWRWKWPLSTKSIKIKKLVKRDIKLFHSRFSLRLRRSTLFIFHNSAAKVNSFWRRTCLFLY